MQCPLCGSPLTAPDSVCPRCHGKGIVPQDQATTPAPGMMPVAAPVALGGAAYQMQQWHFGHAGGQLGPVPGAQIPQLIQQGQITSQTMVWRQGMPNWSPAAQSELAPLFQAAPPIPYASGAPSPSGFVNLGAGNQGYVIPGYAQGNASAVHDGFAWGVAFGPLWGTMLLTVAAALLHRDTQVLVWGVILGSVALLRADMYLLKKAGYETKGLRGWAVLRPVYLFRRATMLNRAKTHAWVWIGLFAASLVLAVLLHR